MNTTSTIQIDIALDEQKMPAGIAWQATGKSGDKPNNAKAMLLAFWDKDDKTALRIDLWTKDMMVDEMTDFFYQTLVTMADTYQRATQQGDLTEEMKKFAGEFLKRFREKQGGGKK